MGLFSTLASSAFQKSDDGKSLYYFGGPFSKPYIIETPEQETVLKKKLTNIYRVHLPLLYAIIFFSSVFLWKNPRICSLLIIIGGFLLIVSMKLWNSKITRNMKKLDSRIPLRQFYKSMSEKLSLAALLLGFIGSLGFVAIGIWILFYFGTEKKISFGFGTETHISLGVPILAIIFFGLCAVAIGYQLILKLKDNTQNDKDITIK